MPIFNPLLKSYLGHECVLPFPLFRQPIDDHTPMHDDDYAKPPLIHSREGAGAVGAECHPTRNDPLWYLISVGGAGLMKFLRH